MLLLQRRVCVGVLLQSATLFDSMPIWENIAFVLRRMGMHRNEARDRVGEVPDLVGLPGIGDKIPVELSCGIKKRVMDMMCAI